MEKDAFNDAFLDREYLKLDEGSLGFIFTEERLAVALAVSQREVSAMLRENHGRIVALYADTTKRILHEAFYTALFEELAALPDAIAFPFIHLALGRIEDAEVEAARVKVVKEFQSKRKKPHH